MVKIHESVIILETEHTVTAVQDDVVLLAENDRSAVRLVERDGIVLAELLLQEFLGNFVSHNLFLLDRQCRNCIHTVPAWFR